MVGFMNSLNKGAWIALPLVLVSLLVGCTRSGEGENNGTNSAASTTGSAPSASGKALKIGMVFDSGGRGDGSFNDSAYAGLEKAQKEFGVEISTADSKSEKDYETNLASQAEAGFDVIFAIGITQMNALNAVAPKFPNVKFAIVDADVKADNVRSLLFSEEEGSYLAGFVAAGTSKTGKIGFVGGKKIPLIEKFEAGYKAGALAANPKIIVLPSKYTESWDDTLLGKQSAASLFGDGADVVYHAAGRCGLGVIAAAKEAKKFAIGVDSNQDDQAPGTVLTSMIKRVDVAVFNTIKDVKEGNFSAGSKVYNLKVDGVGLSDMKNTKDKVPADILGKLDSIKKDIVDGKVVVPTKL